MTHDRILHIIRALPSAIAVSGTVPTEPVVCVKSGHVYEKSLIEKHVQANGTDPVTGEEISAGDLLPLRGTPLAKPRPVAASSVAGLLSNLQSEWDGLMLETFQLRKTLDSTRQELSQALYQHDAACRVIARLIKERDQARASLTAAQTALAQRAAAAGPAAAGGAGGADVEMEGGSAGGMTEEVLSALKDKHKELSKAVSGFCT